MKKLIGMFRIYLHCLLRFHRYMKAWDSEGIYYMDCADCDKAKKWVRNDYGQ